MAYDKLGWTTVIPSFCRAAMRMGFSIGEAPER
jgi:hypothetical protein